MNNHSAHALTANKGIGLTETPGRRQNPSWLIGYNSVLPPAADYPPPPTLTRLFPDRRNGKKRGKLRVWPSEKTREPSVFFPNKENKSTWARRERNQTFPNISSLLVDRSEECKKPSSLGLHEHAGGIPKNNNTKTCKILSRPPPPPSISQPETNPQQGRKSFASTTPAQQGGKLFLPLFPRQLIPSAHLYRLPFY